MELFLSKKGLFLVSNSRSKMFFTIFSEKRKQVKLCVWKLLNFVISVGEPRVKCIITVTDRKVRLFAGDEMSYPCLGITSTTKEPVEHMLGTFVHH